MKCVQRRDVTNSFLTCINFPLRITFHTVNGHLGNLVFYAKIIVVYNKNYRGFSFKYLPKLTRCDQASFSVRGESLPSLAYSVAILTALDFQTGRSLEDLPSRMYLWALHKAGRCWVLLLLVLWWLFVREALDW